MQIGQNFYIYKHKGKYLVFLSTTILILTMSILLNNNDNSQKALGQFFFNENKHPMLTYENQNLNFKINYPDNWERSSNLNNETIFIAPKETDIGATPAGIVVKVIPIPIGFKNYSLISITNMLISQLKTAHKDFKLESSGQFTIDSKNGRQILFTATDNNLQNRKAWQITTIDKNNIFIITYKAYVDKYSQYEDIIKSMISSFRFLSP